MLQRLRQRGYAQWGIYWVIGSVLGGWAMTEPSRADEKKAATKNRPKLEDKLKTLSKGDSSNDARERGIEELSLHRLPPEARKKATAVVESLSLFRELPTFAFEVHPEVHRFFLDHPEAAVGIWQAMKISKFHLTPKGPGLYHATDNEGTKGLVEVLHQDEHNMIVICDGVVHSPLLPGDISARTLLHLQWDFVKTQDDVIWSRNRLRMYVAFPSTAIEAAAKLVAPLGNMIIDRNLKEVCLFVGMMSLAMEHQPGWVERIAHAMPEASQDRREALISLAARVFVTARKRKLAQQGTVTLEDVTKPLSVGQSNTD